MAALPIFTAASKRSGFPEAVTVNCLVERDPTSQAEPVALIARPGTVAFGSAIGFAPIRCVFQKQGVFNDEALILASTGLYRVNSAGTANAFADLVLGNELVDIDAATDPDGLSIARIATGSALYVAQNDVVTQETFPDSANAGATSVAFLSGYWLATEAGTDALFYQKPGETTWNAIQFAAAEYAFDRLKGIRVVGELAWLLGESTLEGWRATGDAADPLAPYGGLKFDIGCRSLFAAVNCRGTLIFVDNDGSVRMTSGGEPQVISDNGLAEQIMRSDASGLRASFFVKDQHPVYVLTIGSSATWLYDLAAKTWTRATSNELGYLRNDLFCNMGDVVLCRDALTNQLYKLDPDLRDDGGHVFTMEFCAYLETKERSVPIANVELHCEVGGSPLSGQGSNFLIGMQMSIDGCKTFGTIRYRSLGATGKYRTRVRWNALGMAQAPFGAWFRFFISDPGVRRVSGLAVNVP